MILLQSRVYPGGNPRPKAAGLHREHDPCANTANGSFYPLPADQIKPVFSAFATAAARDETPSLSKIFST